MSAHSELSDLLAQPVTGGRLCVRHLKDGDAMVGLLHLPAGVVPIEGAAYLLIEKDQQLRVAPEPLDQGLAPACQASSIGELCTAPIWSKTVDAHTRVVRFFAAFPETNSWTVVGPSSHADPQAPSHSWFDVDANGRKQPMAEPFESNGLALGQLLTNHPVWPDAHGKGHTLPQMSSAWRQEYFRYHQLLVQSTHDPELDANLEKVIARDPAFSEISVGRIDRDFCRHLANLDAQGLLVLDAPQSVDFHRRQNAAVGNLVESLIGRQDKADQANAEDAVTRHSLRRRGP
jgi:hypothetical protein